MTSVKHVSEMNHIAKEVEASKNGVRSILLKAGNTLRENSAQVTHKRQIKSGKNCARPHFGFCVLERCD